MVVKFKIITSNVRIWIIEADNRKQAHEKASKKLWKGEAILWCIPQNKEAITSGA